MGPRAPTALARETVLITGASAGLGVEFARLFAADGSDIVLVARREERLRALANELADRHGVSARVLAADLSEPDAAEGLMARLASDGIEIDVLVNNAGFGARGPVAEIDAGRQAAMAHLNVGALTGLSRALLPGMIASGHGGILNVASMAAFQAGPCMAVYYATKAYVLSFTEALHEEVRGTGVRVSCFCPGPVATEFAEMADMTDSKLFEKRAAAAAPAARAGYEGFRANRAVVIPGLGNKLGIWLQRLVPRAAIRRIVARMQR
ncbi:MAG: SDR family oxidoreductase [Rhodospirillaceae bacterium]|jgi:uncharacterized protein|nr:SDR family oxidoreductase [Rhodospirillaceae bacterium]MBT6118902.1 SDR family oxidoreductase [Rhodospirillaceae bacterium]